VEVKAERLRTCRAATARRSREFIVADSDGKVANRELVEDRVNADE